MTSDQSPRYADAISGIESGGNYGALGPETKGDRAYGKFQIMGNNIPQWSQEALGQPLTPEQFLASPQAQDAVFQFKFGQYVNKYGPEGAAQAWFGGPGAVGQVNRKDVLGTTVGSYGQRFMAGLGQPQDAPQQPASAPPVPGSFQPMPAYGWTPNNAPAAISEAPQSQPMPQMPQAAPMNAPPPLSFAQRRPPDPAQLQALLKLAPALGPAFSFLRTS